jgi:hypothetical protein
VRTAHAPTRFRDFLFGYGHEISLSRGSKIFLRMPEGGC